MPRLLGIRFESIGHRDARLDGLILPFEVRGAPEDSVLWLRNGGGKSSILNLAFSVLRPNLREFLGSEADAKARHLEDYVAPEDTSSVCLAWELDGEEGRRPLVFTCGVYSWSGSENTSLVRRWFALRVEPDRRQEITLASLPLLSVSGGVRRPHRQAALREKLLELHDPPSVTFTWVHHQAEWEALLESYGLDPQVFSYQLKMNRSEGAADHLFRHRSADQLVDFLIEILLSPEEPASVRETLGRYAAQIARRPALERELAACEATTAVIAPLTAHASELDRARDDAAAQAGSLRALHDGVVATERARKQEATELAGSITRLTDRHRQAGQQRLAATVNASVYEAEAAILARARADEQLRAAATEREVARGRRAVLRAAERLAEVRRMDAAVLVKRRELDARLEANRPMLEELRAAASDLDLVLREELNRVQTRAALARSVVDRLREDVTQCRARRDGSVAADARLRESCRSLEATLTSLQEKRSVLERRGDLLTDERPRAAVVRLRADSERHEAVEIEARAKAASLADEAAESQATMVELRSEARDARRQAGDLRTEREAAEERRKALVGDETLRGILGDDHADIVRLGAEIATSVRTALARLRETLLRLRVDAREDERASSWLEQQGILPSTIDAEVVRDELRRLGVNAHTGNVYLASNQRGEHAAACARARPALAGGVVVDVADMVRARELLAGCALKMRAPLTVGTTADLLDASVDASLSVMPPAGFWDRDAASNDRVRLETERDQKEARRVACSTQQSATEDLLRRLEVFVSTFNEVWYARTESCVVDLDARAARASSEAEVLRTSIERANGEQSASLDEAKRAAALLRLALASLGRVEGFADEGETVDRLRGELDETRAARDAEGAKILESDAELLRLGELVVQRDEQVRGLSAAGSALERELRVLTTWVDPALARPESPRPGIDELRALFAHLHREYETRTTRESLQGEIATLVSELDRARTKLAEMESAAALDQTHVERALDEADSGIGLDEASRRAEHQLERALERVGLAEGEAKAAAGAADTARGPVQKLIEQGRSTAVTEARAKARGQDAQMLHDRTVAERETATRASTEETECEAQRREAQSRADSVAASLDRLDRHRRAIATEREHFADVEPAARAFDRSPEGPTTFLADAELNAAVEVRIEGARASSKHVRDVLARIADVMRRVASFGSSDSAAALPPALRDRLRDADVEAVLRRAPDILADVEARRVIVGQQLAQLEQHRKLIAQSLGRTADKAIDLLRKLERASTFPSHVKVWGDHPFLKVKIAPSEVAAERDASILTVVDHAAAASQMPSALQLVQQSVRELTRATGVRMSMLKPEVHRRLEWVPIEDINRFSGGERITAAILLYATLAQLRARQRGRSRAPTSVLLLDNPVGACSHPEFLELQREMARASGVQLVYTTGVDDLEALARLPNVVRLRNAHRDTRARRRVTVEPAIDAVHVAWTKS